MQCSETWWPSWYFYQCVHKHTKCCVSNILALILSCGTDIFCSGLRLLPNCFLMNSETNLKTWNSGYWWKKLPCCRISSFPLISLCFRIEVLFAKSQSFILRHSLHNCLISLNPIFKCVLSSFKVKAFCLSPEFKTRQQGRLHSCFIS